MILVFLVYSNHEPYLIGDEGSILRVVELEEHGGSEGEGDLLVAAFCIRPGLVVRGLHQLHERVERRQVHFCTANEMNRRNQRLRNEFENRKRWQEV